MIWTTELANWLIGQVGIKVHHSWLAQDFLQSMMGYTVTITLSSEIGLEQPSVIGHIATGCVVAVGRDKMFLSRGTSG